MEPVEPSLQPGCGAARLLRLSSPCEGPADAVLLLDQLKIPTTREKDARGIRACVHHGANLYSLMHHARVYPTRVEYGGAALEVYRGAQDIAQARADAHVGRALAWVWEGGRAA